MDEELGKKVEEIDRDLEFMVNLYKRLQAKGYSGTFKDFLDEIFYPIVNYSRREESQDFLKFLEVVKRDFAQMLFSGRKPEEIKEILESLTEDDIMKEFNVTKQSVFWARRHLNLALRPRPYPSWLVAHYHEVMHRGNQQVFDYLKQNRGFCSCQQLLKIVGSSTVNRMTMETKIIRVDMNLSRQPGGYKYKVGDKIFNEGFYQRVFYCLGRTGLVRLMQKALKKPENMQIRKTLTAFMRNYLTEAERIAILWSLGIRKWKDDYGGTNVKDSIQIDGIVMPRGKYRLAVNRV